MLYTCNLCNVIYQLHFNKTGRKRNHNSKFTVLLPYRTLTSFGSNSQIYFVMIFPTNFINICSSHALN